MTLDVGGTRTARRSPPAAVTVPGAIAISVVALQICYPLIHGVARERVTVAIVVLFAAGGVLHAAITRGSLAAGKLLVITAGFGYLVELIGVHTGFPFGPYRYSTVLEPKWFGVPPVVGLAWTMLAWPAALVAHRLARRTWARVAIGTWALASADLFLDPQLVALHAWTWRRTDPHLPGVEAVPLTNYAGWLLVSLAIMTALRPVADRRADDGADAVPVILYLWLWAGWGVAQAVFLDQPASALWGVLGMGVVAVPLLVRCLR